MESNRVIKPGDRQVIEFTYEKFFRCGCRRVWYHGRADYAEDTQSFNKDLKKQYTDGALIPIEATEEFDHADEHEGIGAQSEAFRIWKVIE